MGIGMASEEGLGGADTQDWNIDAVGGATQCYKCGGYGHMARECPTKGNEKGKEREATLKGKEKAKTKEKEKERPILSAGTA